MSAQEGPGPEADSSAQITALRERYAADVAGGIERFFAPPRRTCPWCGGTRLRLLLRSPDLVQHKPGEFRLVCCRTCGHVFQNPRLNATGLEYYYRNFYDGPGANPDIFEFGLECNLARARQLLPFHPPPSLGPRRWLDVGTAYGHFCRDARQVWPHTRFEGLDMGTQVEEGRRRGWLDEAHRGLLLDLAPLLAGQFDVVSMHHYLEHTTNPRAELDAATQLLAPDGFLLIEVPNPESRFGRAVKRWWFPWLQPQHLHLVPRANLMQALLHRGLQPVAEVRGEAHLAIDLTFLVLLPLSAWGPYPGMPWFDEEDTSRRKRRHAQVLKYAPKLHRAVQPLERLRTRVAVATDRGNTYRVLARRSGPR